MKVYTATVCPKFEGETHLGVFTTTDAAKSACQRAVETKYAQSGTTDPLQWEEKHEAYRPEILAADVGEETYYGWAFIYEFDLE